MKVIATEEGPYAEKKRALSTLREQPECESDALGQTRAVDSDDRAKMDAASEPAFPAVDLASPIAVSACLLGEPCRYDGRSQPCAAIIELGETHELVPLCPEVLGGLPTPRTPSEIQADGRVVDATGIDKTAAFEAGAREALRVAQERGCRQAILKENSPSCGPHRIYDGTFSGTLVPGKGKTAALFIRAGIGTFSEKDL